MKTLSHTLFVLSFIIWGSFAMAQQKDISLKQLSKYNLYTVTPEEYDFKNHKFYNQSDNSLIYRIDVPSNFDIQVKNGQELSCITEDTLRYKLPFSVNDFPNLLELNIDNAYVELPDNIGSYSKLIKLSIYNEKFNTIEEPWEQNKRNIGLGNKSFNKKIWSLENLKELTIFNIYLNIDDDFVKLPKLEVITLNVFNADFVALANHPSLKEINLIHPYFYHTTPPGGYIQEYMYCISKSILINKKVSLYDFVQSDKTHKKAFVLKTKNKISGKVKFNVTSTNIGLNEIKIFKDDIVKITGYYKNNTSDSTWSFNRANNVLFAIKNYKTGKAVGKFYLSESGLQKPIDSTLFYQVTEFIDDANYTITEIDKINVTKGIKSKSRKYYIKDGDVYKEEFYINEKLQEGRTIFYHDYKTMYGK